MVQPDTSRPELDCQSANKDAEEPTGDRRRPGRSDSISPTLIPLLRGALTQGASLNDHGDVAEDRGDLAPVVGIAVSVVLTLPRWAILGLIGWAIFG